MCKRWTNNPTRPALAFGSVVHVFFDVPTCKKLEGPAQLVYHEAPANPHGWERWVVKFLNKPAVVSRLVHPKDAAFTTGQNAVNPDGSTLVLPIPSKKGRRHGK